ncbi:MAG: protein-L-isoaspartate(D-aspartate) O-methyltransferase [Pseudomonadota bacterium]
MADQNEAADTRRAETLAALTLALRKRGITDNRVLSAMERVPREAFVDTDLAELAYGDHALPIACGQTISQPYIVALMTQALDVGPEHSVLELGTGSGYQTAVLARLAKHIISLERYRGLSATAQARLEQLQISNAELHVSDGYDGWAGAAPYDRILITAAVPDLPKPVLDQLADPGVLVAPRGRDLPGQDLIRLVRQDGTDRIELLAEVRFVPLVEGLAKEL